MSYLKIYIKDEFGNLNPLPYPISNTSPVFVWDVPQGITQSKFCLELKTKDPVTLSNGSIGYAYYNSSLVTSSSPEHQISLDMYQNVWRGIIEVRIRLYDIRGNLIYSTHTETSQEYSFEPTPQGYSWDSDYDGYYYLLDDEVEQISGTLTPSFEWRNSSDEDNDVISYELQWGTTPLFTEGEFASSGKSVTKTVYANEISGLKTNFETVVDVKSAIFYRVRAYDGMDYSSWSEVDGFYYSPSSAPYCEFIYVKTNCTSDNPNVILRPNGEVDISFRVNDADSDIVSAYLLYKLNDVEYPCSLNCSTVSIQANENTVVKWFSARQLPNQKVSIYLYLYAFDGESESQKIIWQSPISLNNIGIGFGYNDSTNDRLDFRLNGGGMMRSLSKYIQIPREKTTYTISDGVISYRPAPIPGSAIDGYRFNWAEYWYSRLYSDLAKHEYFPGDFMTFSHIGNVKLANYNLYDGYDDGDTRNELANLFLEYRDEFNGRKKDETESFIRYYYGYDYEGYGYGDLGRGTANITYFLKRAQYGRGFNIKRPGIVYAADLGLYFDGAGLNSSASDYFGGDDTSDIASLKKQLIWRKFYQVASLYSPSSGAATAFLGPRDQYKYDEQNGWYWTLFEYAFRLNFPFSIIRGKNDRYAYRFNGTVYSGSLLEDGIEADYFSYSPSMTDALKSVFAKLFPSSIFQEIRNFSASGNQYSFMIYSRWIDSNKTFSFVDTENNCYSLFKIDKNERFSKRNRASGTERDDYGHELVIQNVFPGGANVEYEIPCDTGNCVGEEGEINQSEPLFTCDPIHVNKYGCHYKYTPKRYLASGKVYVRKYAVRVVYKTKSQEPLREKLSDEDHAPQLGYRNFTIEYVGKSSLGEDLYVKKTLHGVIGGVPAKSKMINVIFEQKEIQELGWWEPYANIDSPSACISHQYVEGKGIYYRKNATTAAAAIGFKDCYVAEYVELNEAWEKPFFDKGNSIGRINKSQPMIQHGEIPSGYIQYVLGAYKPPKDQEVEISKYESKFSSVVETEAGYRIERYDQYWNDRNYSRYSEKLGTVVDPSFFEIKGIEKSYEKWGYVPNKTLQNYFKKDDEGIWEERIIPRKNSYVHNIFEDNDISFNANGRIHLYKKIISDKNRIYLPESEGIKVSDFDYRLTSWIPLKEEHYYSALPRSESEAYQLRPPEIYGEDRPLRISGFIDSMSQIIPWKIIYLQTSWNTYNLIHWEGSQDENVYAKLEVAIVDENGTSGEFMTVKTKEAVWYQKHGWLIPYEKLKQSDYIDTLNASFSSMKDGVKKDYQFEDGKNYRFRISGININSEASNTPVASTVFTYSKQAYSPPVITNIEYDKWTKEFSIEFRFDDAYGRKYDIINIYYVTYAEESSSPPDSAFKQLGASVLEGNLENLDSNKLGDNVISEAYLIKHKVFLSSEYLEDFEGKNIRFRLEAIASEDREGLTTPVFRFLMWGNEFLQKADKKIERIAGKKNRWKYQTTVNEDGEVSEGWVYLDENEAISVPGSLSIYRQTIDEINDKFETWYSTVAKYDFPSFDAKYNYIISKNLESQLYSDCFAAFILEMNLNEEWLEFQEKYPSKQASYLEPLFISKNGYSEDFEFFWQNCAHLYLTVDEGFEEWFEENKVLSQEEAKILYLENDSAYSDYLTKHALIDNDDSRSDYITESNLQESFKSYYERINLYHDGKYEDRLKFVSENYAVEFENWKSDPINAFGDAISPENIANEDDALKIFIAHDRGIYNAMSYTNKGKSQARVYFMSVPVNGVTYNQQIQTAISEMSEAQKELNQAYRTRNKYETLYRRRLISKGYFSNGWKNNHVYTGSKKNEVFRFRVEHQPVTGKRNSTYDSPDYTGVVETSPVPGYDTRWDIFFRFQMDFYDSFDSQNGKPLRDYLWQRMDCSGYSGSDVDTISIDGVQYIRIMGGIEADSGDMHILPENVYDPDSVGEGNSPTTNDPYSYQFAGHFSILKSELPGELETDILPELWSKNSNLANDDYNHLYFWRVCPYNVLKRPIMDREISKVTAINYFGESYYDHIPCWKVKFSNDYFGNFKYSLMKNNDSVYYVWVATSKRTPEWKKDIESSCWNSSEPFYKNFYPGTDENRFDIKYESNPARSCYQNRLQRGEVVFLTDRPRELISENELQYIESDCDHFKSLWIPFSPIRNKPCMFFDSDAKCWFIISQKISKIRDGYNEYVFTLSRGLSPQTFGEECQLFPFSAMDYADSVINGAKSFENPFVFKHDGRYIIYFNVRKDNGVYEVWKAESENLYDWSNFTKIELDDESIIFDPAVYPVDDNFILLGVKGTEIFKYNSQDGINFIFETKIHSDMYALHRPVLMSNRVYFGIESSGKGKILSIDENGEYSSLQVEKGSSTNFDIGISFTDSDQYFNPFVFEDIDKGVPISRMVYEKPTTVYAYNESQLQETEILERAIFTEYLEEYNWSRNDVNSWASDIYRYDSTIRVNGQYYPILKDANGTNVNLNSSSQYIPVGNLELIIRSSNEPLAIKIPLYQDSTYEEIEAEGEWLDFYNVGETDAVLSPETVDEDYDPSSMTTERYIIESDLSEQYSNWLHENHPNDDDNENMRIEFLLSSKQYSGYLKWGKRGPGVYRYLSAVKRMHYTGDGE